MIGTRDEIAAGHLIAPCTKLAVVLASKRLPRWGWGIKFCVLGPLQASVDGRSVPVGGGRQRALLALLLVHAGEVVSRDRLIEELWAGKPPPGGSQSLDAYLSRLRRAFREAGAGDVLATNAPGYVLHAEETDARRFEALAAQGREALAAGEAGRAAQVLAEALALWRGAAYVEVADESWARIEAGRLAGLCLSAIEDRIEAEPSLGRHAALVPELESWWRGSLPGSGWPGS
jgi:DNA-binding SARP family transcriptional activator